jgi:hypothetical protein
LTLRHVTPDAARPVPALVEESLEALDMPCLACWLRA